MKVMHLLRSNRYSGAENVVCQVMEMFRYDNIEMVYVSPRGPIEESLKNRNISFYGLNNFNIEEIKKAVADIKPNIIHAHDVFASVVAAFVSNKNITVISHMHVNNSDMSKINIKTIVYRIMARRFRHIFWVSNSSYESYVFRNIVEKKSSVLFNVVDKGPILQKAKNAEMKKAYDIVFIGRIQYQKNPEKLLNVFKIVKEKYKEDFSAAIIGVGPLYKEVEENLIKLNLSKNVEMLGFIENPMGLLENAKLMVLTSRFEGTPMCALEAMALGTPIVSTATDGMIDLIKSGENGYLYNGDEDIARAINEIMTNGNCRERMSICTKKTFDNLMNLQEYKYQLKSVYEG